MNPIKTIAVATVINVLKNKNKTENETEKTPEHKIKQLNKITISAMSLLTITGACLLAYIIYLLQ